MPAPEEEAEDRAATDAADKAKAERKAAKKAAAAEAKAMWKGRMYLVLVAGAYGTVGSTRTTRDKRG
jgi:hypothetical protein